jgi:DNA-binding transcriptional MerR regulator
MMSQKYFKINEISKLYGIGIDSLRYYEEIGLLVPMRNESNNYRYYSHNDIMKLNLIRELRELHFSFVQIKEILGKRNLEDTLTILSNELNYLELEMNKLKRSINTTRYRIDGIQNAINDIVYDKIFIQSETKRSCLHIAIGDIPHNETDYYLISFLKKDGCSLVDTIGRSDGYRLDANHIKEDGLCITKEIFIVNNSFSVPASFVLPAGKYLTVAYQGNFSKSGHWSKKLFQYAKENHISLEGDLFEFNIIDYYETDLSTEFLTLLQIKIAATT